jgi:putative NADPH-quinone reductase
MEELHKWNVEESEKIKEIQEKITNCSEMAFFFPVWWRCAPAILKNFFDANFASWFAFKYGKWWKVTKLLTGKTAKVFATCDAPWFIYSIPFITGINLKAFFKKSIFWFCGIKLTEFKLISKFHKLSENERKEILDNI